MKRKCAESEVIDGGKKKKKVAAVQASYDHLKDGYGSRIIVLGRAVNFDFFRDNGLGIIKTWFKDQSLLEFVKIKEYQHSRLVRQFYSNLIVHRDKENHVVSLNTCVDGVDMTIDRSLLSKVFKTPDEGISLYPGNNLIEFEGYDSATVAKQLGGKEGTTVNYKLNLNDLSLELNLLRHMVMNVLLPRTGGRDNISQLDQFVMWCITSGKKLNFPFYMLHHLAHDKHKSSSLPYGMALTRIFTRYGLDLKKETEKSKGIAYSKQTLVNMGYQREGDSWVRAKKKKSEALASERAPVPTPMPLPQTSHTPTSCSRGHPEVMELLLEMKNGFKLLKEDRAAAPDSSTTSLPKEVVEAVKAMLATRTTDLPKKEKRKSASTSSSAEPLSDIFDMTKKLATELNEIKHELAGMPKIIEDNRGLEETITALKTEVNLLKKLVVQSTAPLSVISATVKKHANDFKQHRLDHLKLKLKMEAKEVRDEERDELIDHIHSLMVDNSPIPSDVEQIKKDVKSLKKVTLEGLNYLVNLKSRPENPSFNRARHNPEQVYTSRIVECENLTDEE